MRVTLWPAEIRQIVFRTFLELGMGRNSLAGLIETVRPVAGRCMARSYRAGGLMAMWLMEVGLLQFYDAEGNMLRTINLFEEHQTLPMAA